MNTLIRPALALALAVSVGAVAQAHAKLVSAMPAAGAVVGAPPALDLGFSEAISGKMSGAAITDAAGKPIASSAGLAPKSDKGLMVMLKAPLKPGVYTVAWHAVASDDGHRTSGTYSFTVK